MGKGDQRSRRGKIWRGTFGKRRLKKSKHAAKAAAPPSDSETKPQKKSPKPPSKGASPDAADSGGALDSPAA
jgi:ribosomal small subunit protein bTHX